MNEDVDDITDMILSLTLKLYVNLLDKVYLEKFLVLSQKSSVDFSYLQQSMVTFANFRTMFRNACVAFGQFFENFQRSSKT